MKIGIVGSGIAGLTAAWLCRHAGHHVTLFEKHAALGLDGHSIQVELDGVSVRGDVPSRMFNRSQWPNLLSLYRRIGVLYEPVDAAQSLSGEDRQAYLYLKAAFRERLSPAHVLRPKVREILGDIERFKHNGQQSLDEGLAGETTLSEFLQAGQYSTSFVDDFLYPSLSSTVCTCSYGSLDHYPAKIILETLRNLGDAEPLLRTKYGSSDVAQRLTAGIADIRLNTQVSAVRLLGDKVQVQTQCVGRTEATEPLDHVLIATPAPVAKTMMPPTSTAELDMLESFSYENIPVIVHTDDTFMPANRRHWATFNMINQPRNITGHGAAMCTVWMNRFHAEWKNQTPVFQTIGPLRPPDPQTVMGRAILQRPVVNQASLRGWQLWDELLREPDRRIWFCGSYATYGVPLLENGVVSSQRVAQRLDLIRQ